MSALFTVPISTGGQFECTSPAEKVYLVTFTSPPDNRLTPAFNEAFMVTLDYIEARYPPGAVITTSGIEKFYSNGLSMDDVAGDPHRRSEFMSKSLYPMLRRLLLYPMPLVSLINGHDFAGGLIVSLHHDYRIQNPKKGYLCMNEVIFGANMDPPLLGIFRRKIASPQTYRALILEGHRFTAQQALDAGIVDGLGGLQEALQFIKEKDLVSKGKSHVYSGLKEEMYMEQIKLLNTPIPSAEWAAAASSRREAEANQASVRMKKYESSIQKSKI